MGLRGFRLSVNTASFTNGLGWEMLGGSLLLSGPLLIKRDQAI